MKNPILFFLVIILTFSTTLTTFAQTGTIKGVVTDNETGEQMVGANVIVNGTSLGAATDFDGKYTINNVPVGEHQLKCSYIGYNPRNVTIVVKSNSSTEVNFGLTYNIVEGEVVIVTAQAEGQLAAINQQLQSNTISNVVSKARIQELPDANAAEAISRLPGTSMVRDAGEGTKVAIRGLEPRLNNVTLNGIAIPSLDFNDRSVDLSLISPDVLDGIELTKAITPDMDADAIGGSINLRLKTAPKGLAASVLVRQGYNSQQNSFVPMKILANVSDRIFDDQLGIVFQGVYDKADRGTDRLAATYGVVTQKREPDQEFRPTEIKDVRLTDIAEDRTKFGGSLLLDYNLGNGKIQLNNIFNRQERNIVTRTIVYDDANKVTHDLNETDNNSNLYIGSFAGDYDFGFIKSEFNISYASTSKKIPKNYNLNFLYPKGYSTADRKDLLQGPEIIPTLVDINLEEMGLATIRRDLREASEDDLSVKLDFTVPMTIGDYINGIIKFGGKYKNKERLNDETRWQSPTHFMTNTLRALIDAFPYIESIPGGAYRKISYFLDDDYSDGDFLGGKYKMPFGGDVDFMNTVFDSVGSTLWSLRDIDSKDYEVTERITSTYLMGEFNIGSRLMILAGARYEKESTNYLAYTSDIEISSGDGSIDVGSIEEIKSKRDLDGWYPMFHLRYKITDWLNIRLAKTKSISRPNFNFLSPGETINENNKTFSRGVPWLKPAVSDNYDASFSVYSTDLGLFTVSGFYKEIDNFFYKYSRKILDEEEAIANKLEAEYGGYDLTDYINSPNTVYVSGLELDFQTQLRFISSFFEGFVFNINYTLTSSNTNYIWSKKTLKFIPLPPFALTEKTDTTRSGRMLRQSDDILNVALGYDYKGFSGRVSLYFQGNTFSSYGGVNQEMDGFTDDLVRWDMQLKQRFGENIQLFFNVNNISDRPDREYEPVGKFDSSLEYYGITGDLGIKYTF